MRRHTIFSLLSLILVLLAASARADRASMNMDPAWMYEKGCKFDLAALYYHRVLRGVREVYSAFHWNGDPANYAAGKYATEYPQLLGEMEQRYDECLKRANLNPDQVKRMHYLTYLWLTEVIDQEEGGQRTTCGLLAAEAERHGDFALAEITRRGEARFCRAVAIPFHERSAADFEHAGQQEMAAVHRLATKAYAARADQVDRIARGNKLLMKVSGLGGPRIYMGIALHPAKVNPVAFQYLQQRLFTKEGQWIGPSPEEVAQTLKQEGLPHAEEDARFAAANVLAYLGDTQGVIAALQDGAAVVRRAAATALANARSAEGWAACHLHADPDVRAAVAPLLQPAGADLMARTLVVATLLDGLESQSAETRTFCQTALEGITGAKKQPGDWAPWWKSLGSPRPGLRRTGPGVDPGMDLTVDYGAWWQSAYGRRPNALMQYQPGSTVQWDGYLVVTEAGEYTFCVRSCGEARSGSTRVVTPGRMGFPGLYLSGQCVRLSVDGTAVVPNPSCEVLDPADGVRIDFGAPMRLEKGLHRLHLEFDYRSKPSGFWTTEPGVRLYWASERFPRDVIPASRLVVKD